MGVHTALSRGMSRAGAIALAIGIAALVVAASMGYLAYASWYRSSQATKYLSLGAKYVNLELSAFGNGNASAALHYLRLAEEYLNKALQLDPKLGIAYYDLCIAFGNDGLFHHYYKLPNDTTFLQAIPWYLEHGNPQIYPGYPGSVWMKIAQSSFEKALYYCHKCLQFHNIVGLCYLQLGAIYYNYVDNYTARKNIVLRYYFEALKHLDQIKRYGGRYGVSSLYQNIARTYLAMAEPWIAVKWYLKSFYTYPIDASVEHLIWSLIDLGNWSGAYWAAMQYLKHPNWESDLGLMPAAISAFYLGWPYYSRGDLSGALHWWDKAIQYCNEIITRFGPSSDYYGEAARLKALIYMYEGLYYVDHGEKARGLQLLNLSKTMLEKDVKAMTEHIEHPTIPAEVPGSYYERALAYYYIGLIDLKEGAKDQALKMFKLAERDLLWLMSHPNVSNREVAHRNYYILSYIALAGLYVKLGHVLGNSTMFSEALSILNQLQHILNTNPELAGWRQFFERKYGSDIAKGLYEKMMSVGGIPVYFGVLEH
ncbi:MAG: hypothetical protein GXO32_06635 [Crenarchaeota archaeon]|nr:hypothetical protein [Thermoproteota archaeon]